MIAFNHVKSDESNYVHLYKVKQMYYCGPPQLGPKPKPKNEK